MKDKYKTYRKVNTSIYKEPILVEGLNHSKFEDLSGKIFGNLTVIKPIGKDRNRAIIYNCKCICERTFNTISNKLRIGQHKSCGCIRDWSSRLGKIPPNKILVDKQCCINRVYSGYKCSCKFKERDFLLTKEDFEKLMFSNCYYCNKPPSNSFNRSGSELFYNGIDRINSKVGYTIENTVTCCKTCNFMKGPLEFEEFKEHIINIKNNLKW